MYSPSYQQELDNRKEAEKLASEKMQAVAKLLGGEWNNDREYSHGAYLNLPNCQLFYRVERAKHQWRLDISSSLDYNKYSGYHYTSALMDYKYENGKRINENLVYECTCALSHPPEKILTYVKRILPGCIELERRAQARCDKNQKAKNLTQESIDKLTEAFPKLAPVALDKDSNSASAYNYDLYSLKLSIHEDSISELKLSYLPLDLAMKILELLKAHPKPNKYD